MRDWAALARERLAAIGSAEPDATVVEELATHMSAVYDEGREDGLSDEEATAAAQRVLDAPELLQNTVAARRPTVSARLQKWSRQPAVPEPRGTLMFDTVVRDVTHALRMLAQSPAFTFAAVAALTLGIAANTAIFSVVNAVLLRPLPYPDADRIVFFVSTGPNNPVGSPGASPAKFGHFLRQSEVTELASAFNSALLNYTDGSFPEQLRGARVSAPFFELTGASTILGRTFTAEEDRPRGDKVVILSEQFWRARMNADPAVLGRAISLGGTPHTVIGVLGQFDFSDLFTPEPQVWIPFQLDPESVDGGHFFQSAGRLKPGVSLEQAQARMKASANDFRARVPGGIGPNAAFSVEPVGDIMVRNVRQSLFVLAGAVGFVLLIACANVANLLLVRATGRKREIAIRTALGGSRGRIVGQVLTESVVLSAIGGVLGFASGLVAIRAMLSINTAGLPRIGEAGALVGVDWRVLLFTTVVSLATGLLFGLIPAIHGSKADLASTLKETGGRSGTGFRQNKTRSLLVVVEFALALTLLVGSALLIRSAIALGRVEPGFDPNNVLTMRMSLTGPPYASSQAVDLMLRNGAERLRSVPGVLNAAATCCVPLEGGYGLPFTVAGRPLTDGPFHGGAGWINITDGYFDVFKIPVTKGRAFSERDDSAAQPVVIINDAFANEFFKDQNPLEHRITIGRGVMKEFATEGERQIIGVVASSRDTGLNQDPPPIMYVPQAQVPDAANALNLGLSPVGWVVRTAGDPYAASTAIQESLRQSTGLPVSAVRSMADVVVRSTSRQRFNLWLMTIFGSSALLLAAIGIYGLMAYSVEQRTQELGIRLSLGADASTVRRMIVVQGMRLALVGTVVGVGASWGLAQFMSAFLFQVEARDPVVFVGVPLILTAVAFFAVWLPALRASRIDPVIALRAE
jgi:putative ABC transport system permease protein